FRGLWGGNSRRRNCSTGCWLGIWSLSLTLQTLRRNVVSSEIKTSINCHTQRLFLQLLQLEVRDGNDSLIVGQLFKERSQSGKATDNIDLDLLTAVIVLLQIFFWIESREHEASAASAILNSL